MQLDNPNKQAVEPLFYNPCISPPRSSSPLGGATWLPVAEAGRRST